jgi:hypothetical protein
MLSIKFLKLNMITEYTSILSQLQQLGDHKAYVIHSHSSSVMWDFTPLSSKHCEEEERDTRGCGSHRMIISRLRSSIFLGKT